MYAIDEDDSENLEEALDNEEDLRAWCLSEESEKMSSGKRRSADGTNKR